MSDHYLDAQSQSDRPGYTEAERRSTEAERQRYYRELLTHKSGELPTQRPPYAGEDPMVLQEIDERKKRKREYAIALNDNLIRQREQEQRFAEQREREKRRKEELRQRQRSGSPPPGIPRGQSFFPSDPTMNYRYSPPDASSYHLDVPIQYPTEALEYINRGKKGNGFYPEARDFNY